MKRVSTAVIALVLVFSPAAPARAASVASIVGSGWYRWGVPTVGCDLAGDDIWIVGTVVVQGDDAGTYAFSIFATNDLCESLTTGHGSGTVSGDISGNITYTRNGTLLTLSGSGAINGHPRTVTAATCQFTPTSLDPMRSFELDCAVVFS